jgi:hypothetical protein
MGPPYGRQWTGRRTALFHHLCDNSTGMAKTVFVRGRSRVIALGRSRSICQDGVKRNYITRRLVRCILGPRTAEKGQLIYFPRVLRRRGGGESEFPVSDQHQITNVNE